MYDTKVNEYFSFVRKDIAPLLPSRSDEVLELGCGAGGTLGWLKSDGYAQHTTGMELCAEPASIARTRVDKVLEGDVNATMGQLPVEGFDLVLCLDVLEHLVDPWETVKRLYGLTRTGGTLIVSLPNIQHYKVVLPLLFKGDWRYKEEGIMDRTHLRFFSRQSATEMLVNAGFKITACIDSGYNSRRLFKLWKCLLSRTSMRDLTASQLVFRAEKLPA